MTEHSAGLQPKTGGDMNKAIMSEPFRQSLLLETWCNDPRHASAARGVCVAICDFWIQRIQSRPDESSSERLSWLSQAGIFERILSYQYEYGLLRTDHGHVLAHETMDRARFDQRTDLERTVVSRSSFGIAGIADILMRDLSRVGSAATWPIRFADGSGHAIAGFCNITGTQPILHKQFHVFDPNRGEFICDHDQVWSVLHDLLSASDVRSTISEVHRGAMLDGGGAG